MRRGAEQIQKNARQPRCGLGAIQALFATKTRAQECTGKPLKGAGLSRVWVSAWSERVPPCRLLLSNREQIQGPKNGSIARFLGLGCYQKSSGFSQEHRRGATACWSMLCFIATGPAWLGPPSDENFFAKLKQYRAIATRDDKTARNFLGAIHLAAIVVWLA